MFDLETFIAAYGAAKQYTDEHGGGEGTSNYEALDNKPAVNGVTLSGDKSLSDLGIVSPKKIEGENLIFS